MTLAGRAQAARARLRAAGGPWLLNLAAMALTLLCLAVVARHRAGPEAYVLAAFLPMAAMRLLARAQGRALWWRCAMLAAAGVAAAEVPLLLAWQAWVGVAALSALACAALWWQGAGRLGALGAAVAALVVRITLMIPVSPVGGVLARALEGLGAAALACGWVWLLRRSAARWRPAWLKADVPAGTAPPCAAQRQRLALQMGAALWLSWAAGQWPAPQHMAWALLSAYLVLEGTQARHEVLHKAGWRVLGASAGTALAGALSLWLPPAGAGTVWALVLVFALSGWLRALGQAWWTAGITTCLSLLYSLMGADALALLGHRLLALCAGAAVALACASLAERLAPATPTDPD